MNRFLELCERAERHGWRLAGYTSLDSAVYVRPFMGRSRRVVVTRLGDIYAA